MACASLAGPITADVPSAKSARSSKRMPLLHEARPMTSPTRRLCRAPRGSLRPFTKVPFVPPKSCNSTPPASLSQPPMPEVATMQCFPLTDGSRMTTSHPESRPRVSEAPRPSKRHASPVLMATNPNVRSWRAPSAGARLCPPLLSVRSSHESFSLSSSSSLWRLSTWDAGLGSLAVFAWRSFFSSRASGTPWPKRRTPPTPKLKPRSARSSAARSCLKSTDQSRASCAHCHGAASCDGAARNSRRKASSDLAIVHGDHDASNTTSASRTAGCSAPAHSAVVLPWHAARTAATSASSSVPACVFGAVSRAAATERSTRN
mmetsp:Transcript_56994/g.158684  ORF Transcript_56994/g.158684 Transcript_56994/m.158684 type:complete len:319 (+) Transcript_56994:1008-1964(+)